MTLHPHLLAPMIALTATLALAACGDGDKSESGGDDRTGTEGSSTGESPVSPSSPDPAGPDASSGALVDGELEGLDRVLKISQSNFESYTLEDKTLTVRFSSGSTDDATANCLFSRSGARGLGLPEDYRLVVSYPDGEQECGG